jgi:hypothetical protein
VARLRYVLLAHGPKALTHVLASCEYVLERSRFESDELNIVSLSHLPFGATLGSPGLSFFEDADGPRVLRGTGFVICLTGVDFIRSRLGMKPSVVIVGDILRSSEAKGLTSATNRVGRTYDPEISIEFVFMFGCRCCHRQIRLASTQ